MPSLIQLTLVRSLYLQGNNKFFSDKRRSIFRSFQQMKGDGVVQAVGVLRPLVAAESGNDVISILIE